MPAATSSGVLTRFAGVVAASWSSASPMSLVPSVRVGPGLTALTRTPAGPNSAAHDLVSNWTAALVEPYSGILAWPKLATMVVRAVGGPGARWAGRHARPWRARPDTPTDDLALAMLAGLRSGLMLSQVRRETRPIEAVIDHLRSQWT